jgi:hypothetical protein
MLPRVQCSRGFRIKRDLRGSASTASPYLSAAFGADEATSFSKRGTFRSGSNMGSSHLACQRPLCFHFFPGEKAFASRAWKLEIVDRFTLFIDEQFGVADDVDEQDVTDFKRDFFFNFGGHGAVTATI